LLDPNPPSSIDSEMAFLGACLVGGWRPFEEASDHALQPEDFYRKEHAVVYAALQKLIDGKNQFDVVTVKDVIERSGRWPSEDIGIGTYLADLSRSCPSYLNASAYAKVVKEMSVRRALLNAAAQISVFAYAEGEDIESTIDRAEATLKRAKDRAPFRGRDPNPDDILARMEGMKSTGIKTRWQFLNSISTGMVRGHLWVIGGFSSTGKSAVMVNLLEDVVAAGGSAMVASTEMSQEQYLLRAMSCTSGIPQRTIRHGGMTVFQQGDYTRARDLWRTSRVRIFDDLYNVTRIKRMARRVKEQLGGLDVVFVDFLQNLNETGDEVKDARISAIQLQQLAKDLDCCVVALSQVSNAMAQNMNESGMGNYYAFKGSGAIKDAADLAIMLDRDRINAPGVLWFNVVKNRHDQIGKFGGKFDLDTGRIEAMTIEEMQMADPNAGRRSKKGEADA
jgi:replicative DNA helicase